MIKRAVLLLLFSLPLMAADRAISEGDLAPTFAVPAGDGQQTDLHALSADRPTVVLFWASWCPYCKALMPHLQSILDEYGSDRVEIIAVSIREDDPADAQNYLQSQGYDFLALSEGDPVAESWAVKGTPRVFLVGSDGRVIYDQSAHAVAPSRRVASTPAKGHAARAARAAPAWAAALRKAIDQQLAKDSG